MNVVGSQELHEFLDGWKTDPQNAKAAFVAYMDFLAAHSGMSFTFKGRPGVSYSLRARHAAQTRRELFVLVDVIDDDPAARWLSVCFYADLVTDPDGLGDVVPAGLLGEDACCFDIDAPETMDDFLLERLQEAARNAAQS